MNRITKHFRDEEVFIISNRPELISKHFPLHSKFIVDTYEIMGSLDGSNAAKVHDALCKHLETWISGHILGEDALIRMT